MSYSGECFCGAVKLEVSEAEVFDEIEQAPGTGDDSVAPPAGETAGEDLEDALAIMRASTDGRVEHCEFVAVGQQRRYGIGHGFQPSQPHQQIARVRYRE